MAKKANKDKKNTLNLAPIDKNIKEREVENIEPCPCKKITNKDNIIFSNNICKLCGSTRVENIVQITESSIINYNIGTSIGSQNFNKNVRDTEGSLINYYVRGDMGFS